MSRKRPTALQRQFGFAKCCSRCGLCARLEWHHITYSPERVAPLCHWCHQRITQRNRRAARRLKRALNNAERVAIWQVFLKRSK